MSSASIPIRPPQPNVQEAHAGQAAPAPAQAQAPTAQPSTQSGTISAELLAKMVEQPWSFDFFQAVRRLESISRNRPPVGQNHRIGDDVVRFGQSPSLAFAGSTLAKCLPPKDGKPPRLTVQFFGLCGPWGPLPLHITEYLHQREKHAGDVSAIRFFDLFNHRMTALFYRAWALHQQTVSFERGMPESGGRPEIDRFGTYVASLMGRGMTAFRQRDALPDLAKLSFAGFLANQSKSADGLAALLKGFFEVPVEIEQFVGSWVEIPPESCCRLGGSVETCSLGATTVVGSRIWDCQQKFRIRIGPVSFSRYQYFLPSHDGLARLKAAIRNYLGDELSWDVQLILRADEVPTASLGRIGQLGWTSWMGNSVREHEAQNLILNPAA